MFDGEDALGQVSTMSLDNQRNLKLAIHRDPVFLKVAEQVAGEMNQWAQGFFGRADHRRLAEAARLHDQDLPRRAACTSTTATSGTPTAPASPRRSSTRRSTSSTTTRALARGRRVARAVPAEDPDGRGSGALERHPRGARSSTSACRRHHQGLRARRAGRSVLPADGDPRRARQALRRLQHRPLGLHQQRLRRDGLGSRRSSTRTSTPSR